MGAQPLPGNEERREMSEMKARIEQTLTRAFEPRHLDVSDDSALHAGHAGNPDGAGGTHFTVTIVADAFETLTRIQRHRAVNKALSEEIADGVHALAINASAPE